MASEITPDFTKTDEELRRRFPPRSLKGLGPGFVWQPPASQARARKKLPAQQGRCCPPKLDEEM